MEGKDITKERTARPKAQKLNKAEVFDILASPESNSLLGRRYKVSSQTISKIRNGKAYTNYLEEYRKSNHISKSILLETLQDIHPREMSAHYFVTNRYLKISFDDLLITIDLSKERPIKLEYNTYVKGQSIEYMDALRLLQHHNFLTV